jgi:GNAT superfamily N-acetyltransferase
VIEGVHLDPVDDVIAAEVRGIAPATRRFASGFPRSEDLDAIGARARGAIAFLVVHDGAVVGTCGTHEAPRVDGVIELGWGLVEPARGRGVGTSAVRALVGTVRASFPRATLLARTRWSHRAGELEPESPASEAILMHMGFAPAPPPAAPGLRSWRLEAQALAAR